MATAGISEDDVAKFRNCPACLIAYDGGEHKPKFMSCHHTFCLQCTKSFSRKQVESIPCPTCGRETTCAIGEEESLATNNYLPLPVTPFIGTGKTMTITRSETFTYFEKAPLQARGQAIPKSYASFKSANLKPCLLQKMKECRFFRPSPCQIRMIPAIIAGHDVLVCADRQSGKTAGYLIPIINFILEQNRSPSLVLQEPVALIIVPYDLESADMTLYQARNLLDDESLARDHILIITLGEINSVINGTYVDNFKRSIDFSKVKFVILDNAGPFESDLKKLLDLPTMPLMIDIQFVIATSDFPNHAQQLGTEFLEDDYVLVADNWTTNGVNPHLNLVLNQVTSKTKDTFLRNELKWISCFKTIILVNSARKAKSLADYLSVADSLSAGIIHEELDQHQRDGALSDFKKYKNVLVSTYVFASRLDFTGVGYVFYYELPFYIDDYRFSSRRSGRLPVIRHIILFDVNSESEENSRKLIKKLLSCGSDIPDILFKAANPGMSLNHGSGSAAGGRRYPVWKLTSDN